MIAGVCGGIGEYLRLDPTAVRVAYVVLGLLAGSGILLYIILWAVIPERDYF
jgi:phage shock protein PspC (stress-responsive transcriptional regulator)